MAAVSERVFVKNCSPSLASKLPCTTTSAGLSGVADAMEMLAACTEPADKAAQANAGNRMNCCLCPVGSDLGRRPEHIRGKTVHPSQRGAAILWHLPAQAPLWGSARTSDNRQVFCCFAANLET